MAAIFAHTVRRWPRLALLGDGEMVRAQIAGVPFSTITYLVYGAISAAQVAMGLLAADIAWLPAAAAIGANLVFYAAVRSGRFTKGRDPGLARTQLVVGILLMYASYAAPGPAATGLLVVMASHVVYSMFSMTPRQVWALAGATMAGLGLTMLACGALWPERCRFEVQASGPLYALLVMPLIALLACRVTAMTQRLKDQRAGAGGAASAWVQQLCLNDAPACTRLTNPSGPA